MIGTNFHKQGYKYNFGELLYEYLYSEHRYVKHFFLETYGVYNSYIRTRTKGRYNVKAITIYKELGLGRSIAVWNHLHTPQVEGEPCRDPFTMWYIRGISSPAMISRRRKIKRRQAEFNGIVKMIELTQKRTGSDELYVQMLMSRPLEEYQKWSETMFLFTEFSSPYTNKTMKHTHEYV